ncbi:FRIGIDA-LIKE PROTEIN [Salix viminalis]|uniref:FRIGIDA-LIKE PROTEIN n=1 Tax=Salix viminalis TaxID=40686 RepID=A0A9Q0UW28_SALVM|nr:FRIGIDA-LIKE PROTEIN [Salix viminalis]
MVVACTATSTNPITVPSPPPTAASIASPFTVTSLGPITASIANPGSRVAPPSSTSVSIRKTKLPDLDRKSPQPNLREKNRLAPKSAASAPVLPSKSVSATKPALNSTMIVACTATSTNPITVPSPPPTAASIASPFTVTSLGPITASIANPVAPIDVTSPSTTAAAATSPIAVTSPSITASTTGSRVAPPSSTSASPSASVPKTEPVCQGGNKRRQAQYQGSDKHPQEQHQGGKKRPRIVKSSEAPIRAPSLQSTGIAPLVFVPLQRAEGPFINPNAPYLNTFGGHYYCGGYRPPTHR